MPKDESANDESDQEARQGWPGTGESPEEVALRAWAGHPTARARVTDVTVDGDRAEVVIAIGDGYPDYVYCVRTAAGWREVVWGNGPVVGWRDRSFIDWSPA